MMSAVPFPPPWDFVTADGKVEIVTSESDLSKWATSRNLEPHNVRHHLNFFTGNGESHHVGGFVVKQKLQWLKRDGCLEYVPVLGGSQLFLQEPGRSTSWCRHAFHSQEAERALVACASQRPGAQGLLECLQVASGQCTVGHYLLAVTFFAAQDCT